MSTRKAKTDSTSAQPQRSGKSHYREEYLVQVTVMEARQLKGKDSSGTSDPFVKITVGNLPPQVTTTAFGAASAVWNQSFTFTNLFINDMEFEKFEVLLEVIDLNKFATNSLIGRYSIGLATLYRSSNHELYNTWLALTHPESDLEPQGYLLVSAYIVGTDDRPPVHAINEIVYFDEEMDEFEGLADEELTAEQLKARRERAKNPAVIGKPNMLTRKYQMMVNVVRGEDFPILGISNKCDPFVSARCCGNVLITHVANTQKPQYHTKLCFPCEFPVYNDKVVIRVWDKCFMAADNFIANIPEIAKENDFFSLNYLQSRGGIMPFRWFNLYGIPPEEQNPNFLDYFLKGNKLIEGTKFFGRLLLSLSLNAHEKPIKAVQQLNAFREPASITYILRVDTYELQGAKDCGPQVQVEVSVGRYRCVSTPTSQKKDYEQSKKEGKKVYISDAYEWKENKIKIEEQRCEDLPQDKTQIPDIIISLMTNSKFSKKTFKRVAYLRIPVTAADLATNKPRWYALKSISNNLDPSVHSYILLNISLRMNVGNQEIPRIPIKRNIKASFQFAAYLWGGYDLDPESNTDDIEAKIKVRIAHYQKDLQNRKIGRNPIWNEVLAQIVDLDENLEFASNIIVTVDNSRKKLLGLVNLFEATMGEICISAVNCKIDRDPTDLENGFSPSFQFYHIIKDGISQGRILAAFHLYKLPKKKNPMKDEFKRGLDFSSPKKDFIKGRLEFSFVGVRNLPSPVKSPKIRVRIAIDPQFDKAQLTDNELMKKHSFIEQIIEPKNKLLPPETNVLSNLFSKGESSMGTLNPNFLKIFSQEVEFPRDWRFFPMIEVEFLSDGYFQSNFRTNIQIFEKADWLGDNWKSYARNFFENGKKPPIEKGPDEVPVPSEEELIAATDVKITIDAEKEDGESKRKLLEDRETQRKNGEGEDKRKNDEKATLRPGEKNEDRKEDRPEENLQMENKGKKKLDSSYDDEADLFIKNDKFFNAKFEEILEVYATKQDKEMEEEWRRAKIEQLKAEILDLSRLDRYYDQVKTKKINEILHLKLSKMNEEKFKVQDDKNFKGIRLVGEEYNYGREVHKGEIKERLQLPYDKYELEECSFFSQGFNAYNSNVRKIRHKSQGSVFLKGKIKITETIETNEKSQKGSKAKSKSSTISRPIKPKSVKNQEFDEFPFKIFDEKFLDFFDKTPALKVRVYILRCLNLSAQSNHVDTAHLLSGLEGKCSANAYPEICVGSGTNVDETVRNVIDCERSIPQDLNPKFFRMFEVDATLPNDWKLIIRIWNKELIKDSLIGSVDVDLEDRLWGQAELRQRLTYQIYKAHYEAKKMKIKYNFDKNAQRERYEKLLSEINNLIELIDKDFKVPVEYAALMNADKKTSQGIIEMFIEPFPLEVSKLIPPSAIEPPQPMEFEIRLVIWETENIFRTKGVVDIFVRVSQEAFGWVNEGIKKDTDTHLGSDDGYGLFNWRMTFPLQIPCPFPRLRFAVFDMETLSSDESIGECVISFMKIIKRLRTEGKYEMQPRKLKIYHPNFPDEIRGQILVSLNIISKQDAINNPVGDGQSEPNHDPYLEAPKIGRGIGDFLKGTVFDFSLWRFCGMRALKIILASLASLIVTLILFVKPGILVQ